MSSALKLIGLDALEARIRQVTGEAAFMVIWDRTDANLEERLGRFNLEPDCARFYLAATCPETFGADSTAAAEQTNPQPLSFSDILDAACRWLNDVAVRRTKGHEFRRFRVRVYGPKGLSQVESGSFLVKDLEWRPRALLTGAEWGALSGLPLLNSKCLRDLLGPDFRQPSSLTGDETSGQGAPAPSVEVAAPEVELSEVVATLGSSPELDSALKDPAVQKFLRDPKRARQVARRLKRAADRQDFGRKGRASLESATLRPTSQPSMSR